LTRLAGSFVYRNSGIAGVSGSLSSGWRRVADPGMKNPAKVMGSRPGIAPY